MGGTPKKKTPNSMDEPTLEKYRGIPGDLLSRGHGFSVSCTGIQLVTFGRWLSIFAWSVLDGAPGVDPGFEAHLEGVGHRHPPVIYQL